MSDADLIVVSAPCPACGVDVPVGQTFDDGRCPECRTPLRELRQLAAE